MTVALIAIAFILVLLGAGAIAGAAGFSRAERQAAHRRVDVILGRPEGVAEQDEDDHFDMMAFIRAVLGVGIAQPWPSSIASGVLLATATLAAALAFLLLSQMFHLPPWIWAPAVILVAFLPPQVLLRLEQARQEARFVDLFPTAIDMIVRMLRAGLPMTAAIRVVGTEAGSPVKEIFAKIGDQMMIGIGFDQALTAAARKVRPQDFRFFSVAASLQHSTGGNLAATLEILSEIIRKRRAGRLKAKAVTAEVRMSAAVLSAIPFLVVAGLMVVNPAYLAPLVTDPRGHIIVAMAVGLLITGFLVMGLMTRNATRL